MRGLSETPSDFSHPRAWDRNRCTGCLRVRHTDAAIELYTATPAGQVVPGHKLPRLDPEGIAPTLRAGSDSSHGSYTAPRPIHPHRPRCITAREAGRLHGFPDWFSFYPLKWHAYRQIGNAVCPPVAKALGLQVMRALGYTPTKPSRVIELTDEFRLPDERPRTLRRIPQILNYPPVVAHLFAKAFDATTKRLRDSRFSFADVQEAIAKTGVNLSWTRADTFLAEIARSRNVRSILAACLSQGFSIREVTDGTAIGEFVVAGQPEAIDERDFLRVSSREIGGAVALGVDCLVDLNETESLLCLLANPVVRGALWGEPAADIELEPLRGEKGTVAYLYRRLDTPGCAVAFGLGNYPNRVRLARLAKATNRDELVVFVPATNKHVLAARFENCKSAPRERTRAVFAVDGQVPSQKQGKRRTRRDNQPTLF